MKWFRALSCAFTICLPATSISAPQLNWGEMLTQAQSSEMQQNLEIDLRTRWERTLVANVKEANDVPLDPELIWNWPARRFNVSQDTTPFFLENNERMIARMTVLSERLVSDFSISAMMARLDAVHISYRYDGGAWKTLSAGDRLPMDRWPLVDRQPSFNIPLPPGQLDLVMQFAHRGMMDVPVLLQNNRAFLDARTRNIWAIGISMGVNLVMALMGVLLALNFKKSGFLAVSAMSTSMAFVLLFSSGIGGMLFFTGSAVFNDQSKFISNTVWGSFLPLVFTLALGLHAYSKRGLVLSVLLSIVCVLVAVGVSNYDFRNLAPYVIAVILLFVLVFVSATLAWAWIKNYARNVILTFGLSLYASGLFLLFAGYMGMLSADTTGVIASAMTTVSALALMRGLFVQHRMGRQVIARANTSPLRDVLTGLLNRDGMQSHVYKMRERLLEQQTCAVFIYISVLDTQAAMEEHGEQGFEMGMVQMAASLSTSVSGTDGVARISGHAFGISVLMPPDPALAIRTAQKILSRLMVLASHGALMAGSARIALAWMPLNSFRVDMLERRCLATLELLEENKRIGWVGGVDSHKDASQLLRDSSLALSTPSDMNVQQAAAEIDSRSGQPSNLYERIHRIEREMLQDVDTQFLVEEADRLSRELNAAQAASSNSDPSTKHQRREAGDTLAGDYQPTQQNFKSVVG